VGSLSPSKRLSEGAGDEVWVRARARALSLARARALSLSLSVSRSLCLSLSLYVGTQPSDTVRDWVIGASYIYVYMHT
jgi:hypothetical protein